MPEYRVKWEMDVEADTPEEAARVARDYQLDPEAIVGVFDVYKRDGHGGNEHPPTRVRVDLDALEGRYADDDDEDANADDALDRTKPCGPFIHRWKSKTMPADADPCNCGKRTWAHGAGDVRL